MSTEHVVLVLMVFVFALDTHWLCRELFKYDVCDRRLTANLYDALIHILPVSQHNKLPPRILSAIECPVTGSVWTAVSDDISSLQKKLLVSEQLLTTAGIAEDRIVKIRSINAILNTKIDYSSRMRNALSACSSGQGDDDIALASPEGAFKLWVVPADGDCGVGCIADASAMAYLSDPNEPPGDSFLDQLAAQLQSPPAANIHLVNVLSKFDVNFSELMESDRRQLMRAKWESIKSEVRLSNSFNLLCKISDELKAVVTYVKANYAAMSSSQLVKILQSEISDILGTRIELHDLDDGQISSCQAVITKMARTCISDEREMSKATLMYFVLAISANILHNVAIVRQSHRLTNGWDTLLLSRSFLGLPPHDFTPAKFPCFTLVFCFNEHFDLLVPNQVGTHSGFKAVPPLPGFAELKARALCWRLSCQ